VPLPISLSLLSLSLLPPSLPLLSSPGPPAALSRARTVAARRRGGLRKSPAAPQLCASKSAAELERDQAPRRTASSADPCWDTRRRAPPPTMGRWRWQKQPTQPLFFRLAPPRARPPAPALVLVSSRGGPGAGTDKRREMAGETEEEQGRGLRFNLRPVGWRDERHVRRRARASGRGFASPPPRGRAARRGAECSLREAWCRVLAARPRRDLAAVPRRAIGAEATPPQVACLRLARASCRAARRGRVLLGERQRAPG
jgi:hypothetical protein